VVRTIPRLRLKSPLPSSKGLKDQSGFAVGEATVKIPPSVSRFHFEFYEPLPIQIAASDAPPTSDAGLLPLRQFDERIGQTKPFAAVLDDPRPHRLDQFPAFLGGIGLPSSLSETLPTHPQNQASRTS
jgi:hypothetical protein